MTSSRERQQRATARARLAREMAERQAAAKKRRQYKLIGAAAGAVLVVLLGTVWAVGAFDGDDEPVDPVAQESPTPAPEPVISGDCEWLPETTGENPNLREVGTPEVGDPPTGPAQMTIITNHGVIEVEMDAEQIPCTYASFVHLSEQGFYDDTPCHRLTSQEGLYVLQCGDPTGTGSGGPTYRYAEENLPEGAEVTYPRGTVAMAKAQLPASTGSQFFLVYDDTPIPPLYTVVGQITEGLEIVEAIAEAGASDATGLPTQDGSPINPVIIESLRVTPPEA